MVDGGPPDALNHSLHPNPCSLTLLARLRQDKSYPRSLARAHTHVTIPFRGFVRGAGRSGMEENFCTPANAARSAEGTRRPLHVKACLRHDGVRLPSCGAAQSVAPRNVRPEFPIMITPVIAGSAPHSKHDISRVPLSRHCRTCPPPLIRQWRDGT